MTNHTNFLLGKRTKKEKKHLVRDLHNSKQKSLNEHPINLYAYIPNFLSISHFPTPLVLTPLSVRREVYFVATRLVFFQKNTPASDPKQCVGGQQQKILYISLRQPPNTRHRDKSQENCLQDICLCLLYTSYLKILCRSHVSDSCRSVHQ